MKYSRFILILGLLVSVAAFAGCKQGATKRALMAEYVVPPKAVSDISSIRYMAIPTPKVSVSGNYKARRDGMSTSIANHLRHRMEAAIYAERFMEVADEVHSSSRGVGIVRSKMLAHNYHVPGPRIYKNANIRMYANINVTEHRGTDEMSTMLFSYKYDIKRSDDEWGTPYSEINSDRTKSRTVKSRVPYVTVNATGNLKVDVFNNRGQKVYTRTFDKLSFSRKVGGKEGVGALPTIFEISSAMFDKPVADVVAAISPHTVKRELKLNDGGDTTALVLIRSGAYAEAYARLLDVMDANEEKYLKKKDAIDKDFAETLAKLKADGAADDLIKAAKADRRAEIVAAGIDRLPDLFNMAVLCEIMGRLGEAVDFWGLASEANPDDSAIAKTLARVKGLAGKAAAVDAAIKKKGTFDEGKIKEW